MCQICKSTKNNGVWLRTENQRRPYYTAAARIVSDTLREVSVEVARVYEGSQNRAEAVSVVDQLGYKLRDDYKRIYTRTGTDFANQNYDKLKRQPRYMRKSFERDAINFFTFYIQRNRFPLIVTTTDTVKTILERNISALVDQGEGVSEIVRQIQAPNLMAFEVERIVRTEVICASNLGDMYGAKATGYDMEKEWIASMSERTRDSHVIADGQVVPLNQPFVMDNGDRLDFPGDNSYGASAGNTINCRCSVGYNVL